MSSMRAMSSSVRPRAVRSTDGVIAIVPCTCSCMTPRGESTCSAGESYAAAARRELAEELGVESSEPLQLLFALAAAPATGNEFVRVYRALTSAPVVPDPNEIIDGRWLEPAALERWLSGEPAAFTRTFHLIWRQLKSDTTPA